MCCQAFLNAHRPVPSRRRFSRSAPATCTAVNHRVLLVPSHQLIHVPHQESLHRHILDNLPHGLQLHMLTEMHDPYASNTKRWERVWLSQLRDAVGDGTCTSLLGLGSGADACLRLLEERSVDGGFACVLPTGDEYYAAERHGRAYDWQRIREHVRNGRVALLSSCEEAAQGENEVLLKGLRAGLWLQLRDFASARKDVMAAIAHVCGLDEQHTSKV